MDKPEKAVGLLQKAVDHAPDNFTYRMALATVSRGLGMFSDASAEYETLIQKFPDKTDLNYYLAESLTQEGEIGKAIDAYDALENSVGMNEAISIQKYKLYNSLNEPEKAMKEIEKLAAKYPMEPRYQIVMGDLYLEKNNTDKALLCYNKAHEIDPANPYYIVSMANYYEMVGDKEAAETQIRSALVNNDLDVETKVNILSRYIVRLQQNNRMLKGPIYYFRHYSNSIRRRLNSNSCMEVCLRCRKKRKRPGSSSNWLLKWNPTMPVPGNSCLICLSRQTIWRR